MADLQDVYERHGMMVNARELPDYLPMFLEFLSTLPADEARQMLGEPIHVLAAIRIRLEKKAEQDYAAVFAALEHKIGRGSCRERVCQYGSISVVAGALKKK